MLWITYLAILYSLGLLIWYAAYIIWGDKWGGLSLLNMFALFLFIPLPIFSSLIIFDPHPAVIILLGLDWLVFIWQWGILFVPKCHAQTNNPTFKIFTYNVLGYNPGMADQIKTIQQVDADIVTLQELNIELAGLIQQELIHQYPYQILDADQTVYGIGTLSKFPLRRIGSVPECGWVGEPQWLEVDWQGTPIQLINFHMAPTNYFAFEHVQRTSRYRRDEARWMVSKILPNKPTILVGDSNSAPLSDSYRILAHAAQDAWRVAGWGFGHTFPGRSGPGSSRTVIFGVAIPKWLLRIDYIFLTSPLKAIQARLAPFDGISDHRGVVAVVTRKN